MTTIQHKDIDGLIFPNDYSKKQTRVQYLYEMGAMRPFGCNDEWYESIDVSRYYRGVEVKIKVIKNIDGSHRGWKVIKVGDGIRIDGNLIPQPDEVRSVIDSYYEKFEMLLNPVVTLSKVEFTTLFTDNGVKLSRIYDEDGLYLTAAKWMISRMFNRIDKRKILKYLISEGLSLHDAIDFYKYTN